MDFSTECLTSDEPLSWTTIQETQYNSVVPSNVTVQYDPLTRTARHFGEHLWLISTSLETQYWRHLSFLIESQCIEQCGRKCIDNYLPDPTMVCYPPTHPTVQSVSVKSWRIHSDSSRSGLTISGSRGLPQHPPLFTRTKLLSLSCCFFSKNITKIWFTDHEQDDPHANIKSWIHQIGNCCHQTYVQTLFKEFRTLLKVRNSLLYSLDMNDNEQVSRKWW